MKATSVIGLGFGDEGKGGVVDFLTHHRDVKMIVRSNGGGQAAHNVVTPGGGHHTFSQFGSGLLARSYIPTYLSRFFLFDPLTLANEANHLERLGVPSPIDTIRLDERALVVTPFHKASGRLREAILGHGSCGMGIGEAMADRDEEDAIHAADLLCPRTLLEKMRAVQDRKKRSFGHRAHAGDDPKLQRERDVLHDPHAPETFASVMSALANRLRLVDEEVLREALDAGEVIFEGAQGVLLDEWRGFYPHTTWSTTTFENPCRLLREVGFHGEHERIGVIRSYMTRHGAGPFPTEDELMPAGVFYDKHNGGDGWQGRMRYGWFDEVLVSYALQVCGGEFGAGVDGLAVTHLDQFAALSQPPLWCESYTLKGAAHIHDLVPAEPRDLRHQEQLAQVLRDVEPHFVRLHAGDVNEFIEKIESRLCTPVVLRSSGPAASHKTYTRTRAPA